MNLLSLLPGQHAVTFTDANGKSVSCYFDVNELESLPAEDFGQLYVKPALVFLAAANQGFQVE